MWFLSWCGFGSLEESGIVARVRVRVHDDARSVDAVLVDFCAESDERRERDWESAVRIVVVMYVCGIEMECI
jgi:hypothetical protein